MVDINQLSQLSPSFYEQETVTVAQKLLGKFLVYHDPESTLTKVGQISETEAYPGIGDRASHSNKGLTPRTQLLFGPAGHWYIYLIYGMYHCLNVVTHTPESGGAVLIRAVTPIQNLTGKTSGPGLVCKSYEIDRRFNGAAINDSPLTILHDPSLATMVFSSGPRIGVDYAGPDKELPYRFRIAR